jgi:hypothetical protein
MGLRYNPFNGSFDFTRSPGSYLDGEVATYDDLPLDTAAAPLNSAWLVREASGLWFLTRKPAGIYIRSATGGTDRNADYTYASAFPDVFSDANFTVYDDANSARSMQIQVSDNETLTFKVTGTDSVVRSVAFPLSAILLAAVMFASSALAQNIGIVTATNNNIVTGRTGTLTWTNALAFGTNAAAIRTNLGGTTVGDAVFTATNALAGAAALGLSTTNNVQFRRLKMIAADAGDNGDDATLWLDTSGTNRFATIRLSGTGGSAEKYNAYLVAGAAGLTVNSGLGLRVLNGATANAGSVTFSVGSSGNVTMSGTASVAPNQTASSGSSLMTRDLSDARYLQLGLAALTNTSNVTVMRALSGSTNTNHPFSGTVSVVGTNNTNTLVFSNGILQEIQ